jgi:peptidoglycan hydrolase-like protein with peptidoglycan-binding domain
MKRYILSLLLAVCLVGTCTLAVASAQTAELPSSALTSLTHNCPNTAIMLPGVFDPLEDTYLLTVASWVSRVTLTPVSADPNAAITINGMESASGKVSQVFEMSDEPMTVTISVSGSDGNNSIYTIFLQRRPSSARTGVSAGYLTAINQESGKTYLVMDLVTVSYQGDNVSSFTNDNVLDNYKYPTAEGCTFYYGGTGNPVLAENADDFKAHVKADGTELFSVIYIRDEIVSVQPFSSDLSAIPDGLTTAGFISVTQAPGGGYPLLNEGNMGAMVVKLQQALKSRGFYAGRIDGLYGAGLRNAVKAFQLAFGLSQDGEAGEDTQRLLYEGIYPQRTPAPDIEPKPTDSYVTVTAPPDGAWVTLKEGDEGALVKSLQQALKDRGFYKGEIDGFYGVGTRDAIILFQRNQAIKEDGIAGIDTQSALYPNETRDGNPPAVTPVPFQANVTAAPNGEYVTLRRGNIGALVVALQQRLKDTGYYTGEIDGMYGEGTEDAVKNFQRDKGLSQDGEASLAMQLTLFEGKYPDEA